jgi:hypothetical protein
MVTWGASASANGSVSTMSAGHQALGYETSAAAWAVEMNSVDLALRLDDAGASPTTPQGQPQKNVVYSERKQGKVSELPASL